MSNYAGSAALQFISGFDFFTKICDMRFAFEKKQEQENRT